MHRLTDQHERPAYSQLAGCVSARTASNAIQKRSTYSRSASLGERTQTGGLTMTRHFWSRTVAAVALTFGLVAAQVQAVELANIDAVGPGTGTATTGAPA